MQRPGSDVNYKNCCHKGRLGPQRSLRRFFQQPLLQLFLAFNAMASPRHSLKPFRVDLFATVATLAETAFPDSRQRPIHHLQKLPLVVALAEQKFLGVGTGRPVGNILRCVLVSGAAIGLRSRDCAAQLLLPRFQSLLECV
jgi:hypothetical protein